MKWISVDEGLPTMDGFYLIYPYKEETDIVFTAAWERDHFEVWVNVPAKNITHWMPLPEKPL